MPITREQFHTETVKNIQLATESGKAPWLTDFEPGERAQPYNPLAKAKDGKLTTHHYEGINHLALDAAAGINGFKDPRWVSLDDVNEYRTKTGDKSCKLKYGAQPTMVAVYDKYVEQPQVNHFTGKKFDSRDPHYVPLYCADQFYGFPERRVMENDPRIEKKRKNIEDNFGIPWQDGSEVVKRVTENMGYDKTTSLIATLSAYQVATIARTSYNYEGDRAADVLSMKSLSTEHLLRDVVYESDKNTRKVVNKDMAFTEDLNRSAIPIPNQSQGNNRNLQRDGMEMD